jgi:hypothetical protein
VRCDPNNRSDGATSLTVNWHLLRSNRRCSRQAKVRIAAAASGGILGAAPPSAAALFDHLQPNAVR